MSLQFTFDCGVVQDAQRFRAWPCVSRGHARTHRRRRPRWLISIHTQSMAGVSGWHLLVASITWLACAAAVDPASHASAAHGHRASNIAPLSTSAVVTGGLWGAVVDALSGGGWVPLAISSAAAAGVVAVCCVALCRCCSRTRAGSASSSTHTIKDGALDRATRRGRHQQKGPGGKLWAWAEEPGDDDVTKSRTSSHGKNNFPSIRKGSTLSHASSSGSIPSGDRVSSFSSVAANESGKSCQDGGIVIATPLRNRSGTPSAQRRKAAECWGTPTQQPCFGDDPSTVHAHEREKGQAAGGVEHVLTPEIAIPSASAKRWWKSRPSVIGAAAAIVRKFRNLEPGAARRSRGHTGRQRQARRRPRPRACSSSGGSSGGSSSSGSSDSSSSSSDSDSASSSYSPQPTKRRRRRRATHKRGDASVPLQQEESKSASPESPAQPARRRRKGKNNNKGGPGV